MRCEEDEKTYEAIYETLSLFRTYSKIGLIKGDMKEKRGSIRWDAHITHVGSLHDIIKYRHYFYRWGSDDNIWLNFIDNVSRFFFSQYLIKELTLRYKLLVYNIAYRHAIYKNPQIAMSILWSGYSPAIWGYDKLKAKYMDTELDDVDNK